MQTFARWLYKGGRPNRLAQAMNDLGAAVASLGVARDYMETLEVVGRRSGRVVAFPVVISRIAGERYLVAMLGGHVNWVRNVRAAGGRAALRAGRVEPVFLEEVAVERRAPILKEFLRRAPGGRPHIPVDRHAPLDAFAAVAADYPVFRVVPDPSRNL